MVLRHVLYRYFHLESKFQQNCYFWPFLAIFGDFSKGPPFEMLESSLWNVEVFGYFQSVRVRLFSSADFAGMVSPGDLLRSELGQDERATSDRD